MERRLHYAQWLGADRRRGKHFSRCMNGRLLVLSCALAVPAAVSAAPGAGFVEKEFARLDVDRDGRLSVGEAKVYAAVLAGADADSDGYLTRDEVKAHLQKAAGSRIQEAVTKAIFEKGFRDLDVNGDGRLSADEFKGQSWLALLDTDGNGEVTREEAIAGAGKFDAMARAVGATPPAGGTPDPPLPEPEGPKQAPLLLVPQHHGVGRMMPDLPLEDGRGGRLTLGSLVKGRKGLLIAATSATCPLGRKYGPELQRLTAVAVELGFAVLFVPAEEGDPASVPSGGGTALPKPDWKLLSVLGARATTEVFLLDATRTLVYRGAIDDRYGLGYAKEKAAHPYLADALRAVAAGDLPAVQATEAPGCEIDRAALAQGGASFPAPTYHNRISRIVAQNCLECHRTGGIAPFPLETPQQVLAKAGMIRKVVSERRMPPWSAAEAPTGHRSPWINDRTLPASDVSDLLAWLGGDRPLGDAADAPVARRWPAEWVIGTPDRVWQIAQPIEVKAEGTMPYQYATVETGLTEDRWVRGWEVQPTAREVVHHVLVFVRPPGESGRKSRRDGDEDGYFAAFVPGNDHVIYPEGFAKKLPAGSRLRFQIHYTPNGSATRDQVRVGALLSTEPPRHVVETTGIANGKINIPPGAPNHPESATIPVPIEVKVLGFMPHMHLRGKAFRYDVILPDGATHTLLDVPKYDFNWQIAYRLAEPVTLPAGSRVRATGWFDNSSANPANPDPTKTVHWGPQTFDEMMLGYVEFYRSAAPTPTVGGR